MKDDNNNNMYCVCLPQHSCNTIETGNIICYIYTLVNTLHKGDKNDNNNSNNNNNETLLIQS